MMHTLTDQLLVKKCFLLAITAAATNGTIIDCKGYTRAMAVFNSAPSGSGTTSDCKLQEDDDSGGGTMADVTSATFAQVTTAGGAKIETMAIDLGKRKRYLRLVHTGVGASAAGQASGELILFGRRKAPAQDVTVVSV